MEETTDYTLNNLEMELLKEKELHRKKHETLHNALMELVAEFLLSKEHISTIKVDELIDWSYDQILIQKERKDDETNQN